MDAEKDIADAEIGTSCTSLSDLEDAPLTHEPEFTSRRPRRRFKLRWPANESPFWKWWSLAMTVCSLTLLGLLFYSKRTTRTVYQSQAGTAMPTLDYPHPAETWNQENLINKKYYRDTRYMTLDKSMDYLWQDHVHMATGNVRLPDGKGNTTLKSVSMYHQLHCLAKMRMTLQRSREGEDIGISWRDDAHWPHCFDYLRSSILCFADGTLESVTLQPGPTEGTAVRVIDGGVETRYCRDTRPLENLVRQYGPNSHYGESDDTFEVPDGS